MSYTYHDLKGKTVAELREIAQGIEHEAVKGYTQLNKDHLLVALCTALKISTHEHHIAGGYDKSAIKAKMRALRQKRSEAIRAGDRAALKSLRRQIHALNHDVRRHTAAE
jgi:imidazoleglycerol phosphate dehydratase HisB